MKQNVFDVITRLLEIGWRRRTLLAVPVLVMLPLSLIGSRFLPQTYTAKALLVLQETGSDNPLIHGSETNTEHSMRDRAPGLQALFKSDRVLVNALRDRLGDSMPTDSRRIAEAVASLDKQLTFEMIGNNFLELRLNGSDRVGLGRQLEAVTSRFLETLVSPDQDAISATQVVLQRRREDVASAEKALLLFKHQLGERAVAAISGNDERLRSQQSNLQTLTSDISAVDAEIAALRQSMAGVIAPENTGRREAEVRLALAQAEAADAKRGGAATAMAQAARERVAQLTRLQAAESRGAALRRDLAQATAGVAEQSRAGIDSRSPAGQLRRLEREAEDARLALDTTAKRFPAAGSSHALQVLSAPERIRVIDAPKDPEFPSSSRVKMIVASLLAGLVFAIGLTGVAEMFDQHLRHAAEFEAAAGAPVIARLPPAGPEPTPIDQPAAVPEPAAMCEVATATATSPTAKPGLIYSRQSAA